ncbi:HEL207Cp [Eremothecium sinecaudum]|uniref:Leucine aminopeptidase 2 n=1 Tax=Eremothecium sinecaudum TaxID=45286 RepID=A0A0X8HT99_9SACH|nr:HEL207Cp [Eremothecium sinecaudum]AMD21074.1 HEL207Cp [Eremothecium sinecaudum]
MKLPSVLEEKRPAESPEADLSTQSNYKDFQIKHTTLDLDVDFEKREVSGHVTFELRRVTDAEEVRLDTACLDVHGATIDGENAEIELKPELHFLGKQLIVKPVGKRLPDEFKLSVQFNTKNEGTALQWLDEKQTSGKPFVFNQLETTYARCFMPCFDTPVVKSQMTANIRSPYPVVFAGVETEGSGEGGVYKFEQKIPICSYLTGFASGDLVSAEIGPRSKVYSEPYIIKDCQDEFSEDVENFIKTAEDIIFEYEWGTYNILINPSSYPYGGMENPNITFATPTLIAHDKSNNDVIAHELAHSWSGNLVTNANWGHVWLNEGWTVYLEKRIIGAVHGEQTRLLGYMFGNTDYLELVNSDEPPEATVLVRQFTAEMNADDVMNLTPYIKGSCFLYHLETKLGGKEVFDPFIKHYFAKYAKKSLDTWQFLDTLFEFFSDKREVLDAIDWKAWLFTPGMPPDSEFKSTLADEVTKLADRWFAKVAEFDQASQFTSEFSKSDIESFNPMQLMMFLNIITQSNAGCNPTFAWKKHPIATEAFVNIYEDKIFKSQNPEIIYRNLVFQVTAEVKSSYQKAADWLGKVGRMKYVVPLYRLLNQKDRHLAIETFNQHKEFYHPICKARVDVVLQTTKTT